MKVFGVSVLIYRCGLVLAIARRHDYNDFGLPGGKLDEGETPEQAAVREFEEETGYKLLNPKHIFTRMCGDVLAQTFTGDIDASEGCFELVNQEGEPPLAWKTPEEIVDCPTFGEYNRALFKSVGIIK